MERIANPGSASGVEPVVDALAGTLERSGRR
jgi:hypothetical protein